MTVFRIPSFTFDKILLWRTLSLSYSTQWYFDNKKLFLPTRYIKNIAWSTYQFQLKSNKNSVHHKKTNICLIYM